MQVTRKNKVFADEAGKLVYKIGPGNFGFVGLAQLQGINMVAMAAKVGGVEALAEVVSAAKILAATLETGAGAPSSTPAAIGLWYIDTSANKIYFSKGTSGSGDWIITTS